MTKMHEAACGCGDLRVTLEGDPLLVSSCCCTRCQRRTGSFFGVTVYFRPDQKVASAGAETTFQRAEGAATFHFCPRCGSNVWWGFEEDDIIGVAGGSFADPELPSPERMVYHSTRHPFVCVPAGVRLYDDGPPE